MNPNPLVHQELVGEGLSCRRCGPLLAERPRAYLGPVRFVDRIHGIPMKFGERRLAPSVVMLQRRI